MKVFVNNQEIELHNGAKAKDAVRTYYALIKEKPTETLPPIYDAWNNIVGPDGGLVEGSRLFTQKKKEKKTSSNTLSCLLVAVLLAFSACCKQKDQTQELIILSTNDIHAAIDQFPKFAFIVDSLRNLYPEMLLLSGGDIQTGNPANDRHEEKGLPIIELMNAVKFDLSVWGNHEFDLGGEQAAYLSRKADFPFLCANAFPPKELDIKMSPYKIITLKSGLKIAVLGLLQIDANGIPSTHPDAVKEFQFKTFDKVLPDYKQLIDSCDVFIALTHLGLDDDIRLANLCPELDLIVGGHSHTLIEKAQIENGVLITQSGWRLRYASLIKIKLNKSKVAERSHELIKINSATGENKEIRKMVDKYNDNPALKQTIAVSTDDFSSREELGYLMSDAVRSITKTDIALQNRGGVRLDEFSKGAIRIMDVYRLDPFGNEIIILTLSGEELKALFKTAYTVDEKHPNLASGIRLEYLLDEKGELIDVLLTSENGKEIDMNRSYSLATNNYLNAVYQYPHKDIGKAIGKTTADLIKEYLDEIKTIKSYRGEKRFEISAAK